MHILLRHSTWWTRTAVLGLTVALLAACGSGGAGENEGATNEGATNGQASGGGEPVRLVFQQSDPINTVPSVVEAVDGWNREHPDVQVELVTVPFQDALQQYTREVTGGGGPDIMHASFVWVPQLATNGLIRPLDDLIEEDPLPNGVEDFLGREITTVDGKVVALPWQADTMAIVYHPDVLEAAGVSLPVKTYEQLLDVARDVAGPDGQAPHALCFAAGEGVSQSWFLLNQYLWADGKTLIEEGDDGDFQVGVEVPTLVEAVEYFDTYFNEGLVPEAVLTAQLSTEQAVQSPFLNKECAMTIAPLSGFRTAQDASESQLQTAPLPTEEGKEPYFMGGRTLAVNPNAEHPAEAYDFLKYMLSEPVVKRQIEAGFFPAQSAVLDELQVSEAEQAYVDTLREARTFATYVASGAEVGTLWSQVNGELNAVFSGVKTSEEAAQAIVQFVDAQLEGS
jgi:multiple sugar transport system substrate-binding protein